MSRFVVVAVLALTLPGTASAFTKVDQRLRMSDGVEIATTCYVPDGAPPAGGRPAVLMLHGLGETRTTPRNAVGMSINGIAENYLVPQGYVVLTFDARGHGESGGQVSVDGPREVEDVRELVGWLGSQANANPQRIGAFGYSYGGGALWRAAVEGVQFAALGIATAWTELYAALAPQDLARSGVVLGFWQSIEARAAPEIGPIVNDVLAGRNLGAVRAFAAARSSRALLSRIRTPTFLMQGRRDFAFDLDQALTAYTRLKAPKRLYLADFGHAPSPLPAGELAHVLPEMRQWFDRYMKNLPNGIDKQKPVEIAPDPWTGRTASFRSLPARKTLRLTFRGRARIGATGKAVRTLPRLRARLETFGAPLLRVSLASPNGWPHVVAVLSAVTGAGKEIVVSAGGARTRLGSKARQVRIRLISQVTNVPPGSRLRLTVAATSTAQSSGNLLYLAGVPSSARLVVGPATLRLPVLRKSISR
jgi:alpha-beta hydrolase superfamily lysophospholipase